jgi:hypothetical protein
LFTVNASPPIVVARLCAVHQFLDTTLHLFREAWIEWWLDKEQDVDLMKFGDVIRLWEAHGAQIVTGGLRDLIAECGVLEQVAWVLEHLDRTFGLETTAALGLQGQVTEEFLASTATSGPTTSVWRGGMRKRLHARDRRRLREPA